MKYDSYNKKTHYKIQKNSTGELKSDISPKISCLDFSVSLLNAVKGLYFAFH